MYFQKSEHNPPHIHAFYQDSVVAIAINDLKILSGDIPTTALKLIREWINLHKKELLNIWKTQEFKTIEPLD